MMSRWEALRPPRVGKWVLGNGPISLEGALSSDGVWVDHKLRAVSAQKGP